MQAIYAGVSINVNFPSTQQNQGKSWTGIKFTWTVPFRQSQKQKQANKQKQDTH